MVSSSGVTVRRNHPEESPIQPLSTLLKLVPLWALLGMITGCTQRHPPPPTQECATELIASAAPLIPVDSRQLMVAAPLPSDATRGFVYLFERHDAGWSRQGEAFPAMVGRSGFAPPGEKREGDGRTPSGLFHLEFAFGYPSAVTTKMPYRQATDEDIWVDDIHAPEYNQWVRRGETKASSFEEMKRQDHRYRYGLVIDYNRHPVVPALGSAIFMHIWLKEGVSTSGCVALAKSDLLEILRWLDPGKRPLILMGDPRHLPTLPGWSGDAATSDSCRQDKP